MKKNKNKQAQINISLFVKILICYCQTKTCYKPLCCISVSLSVAGEQEEGAFGHDGSHVMNTGQNTGQNTKKTR